MKNISSLALERYKILKKTKFVIYFNVHYELKSISRNPIYRDFQVLLKEIAKNGTTTLISVTESGILNIEPKMMKSKLYKLLNKN